MDIVINRKIEDEDISIIRALQKYSEEHGYSLDRIVFPVGGSE